MVQQNLLNELENLLQQDQAFISDGTILKNAVIEAALKMDPKLLALLLQSDLIKTHFFTAVAASNFHAFEWVLRGIAVTSRMIT